MKCVKHLSVLAVFLLLGFNSIGQTLSFGNNGFTFNKGQLIGTNGNPCPDIKFYGSNGENRLYFANNMVCHGWERIDSTGLDSIYRMDMELLGSNSSAQISGEQKLNGYQNFFLKGNPEVSNVSVYKKLRYTKIYTGIDLVLEKSDNKLDYCFEGVSGANPKKIILSFNAFTSISLNQSQELDTKTPLGGMRYSVPMAYIIEANGTQTPVQISYIVNGGIVELNLDRLMMQLGNKPFKIQFSAAPPPNPNTPVPSPYYHSDLEWSTYFGGGGTGTRDFLEKNYIDESGNLFICGNTNSSDFPELAGLQLGFAGNEDAFVAKFNPQRELEWSSLYGGTGQELCKDVETDAAGSVFFSGWSSSTTLNLMNPGNGEYYNIGGIGWGFIIKLKADGTSMLWGTRFGGGSTHINSLSIRGTDLYIGGWLTSSSLPVVAPTASSFSQPTINSQVDGFLARFTTSGFQDWTTYLGGMYGEHVNDIGIDGIGNLFVVGHTWSLGTYSCSNTTSNFPVCDPGGGAYTQLHDDLGEIFICKFTPQNELVWSTYYGGSSSEASSPDPFYGEQRLAIDNYNSLYVVGGTYSTDFPVQPPAHQSGFYQPVAGGLGDGFILKFDNNGVREWATYMGGSQPDAISAVTIGKGQLTGHKGHLFIKGGTQSNDFPIVNTPYTYNQAALHSSPEGDSFVGWFDGAARQKWTTYFGGDDGEPGHGGIASDGTKGTIVINGGTASTSQFPLWDNNVAEFDGSYNGGHMDGYIAEFEARCSSCAQSKTSEELEEMLESEEFFVYPNPSNGIVTVKQEGTTGSIEILNIAGELVASFRLEGNQTQIDLSTFSKGMYFLKVKNELGSHSQKLILQ